MGRAVVCVGLALRDEEGCGRGGGRWRLREEGGDVMEGGRAVLVVVGESV